MLEQDHKPRTSLCKAGILGHARQLIPNMKIVRQKAVQESKQEQVSRVAAVCTGSQTRGQMKWMKTGGRRGYSFGVLKIEVMPQLMLCNSRSLRQAPARKKWNSSLPWTGFWKDITSIYCSNLRYFTTSGKMDAKGTNAW